MKNRLFLLGCLLFSHLAQADIQATTEDGRKVTLKNNGTWMYNPVGGTEPAPRTAVLTLEKFQDIPGGCELGLRLQNDLHSPIRTMVLRFTAYKPGNIPFETVSRGYSRIKPTANQFQEIKFRGLSCGEIDKVQVEAAHNCHVGDLTKYNASEERCLELVKVMESWHTTIYKAPPLQAE
jgi:hypothetical protein